MAKLKIIDQAWIILMIQIISSRGESSEATSDESTTINSDFQDYGTPTTAHFNNMLPVVCKSLVTKFGDTKIYWPHMSKKNEYEFSSPVCLDELKFPKYRYNNENCTQTKLLECSYIQSKNTLNTCPNGEQTFLIEDTNKICFSNSTKYTSSWDYTPCLRYGWPILEYLDSTLIEYIQKNIGYKFWLPIRRENSYSRLQHFMPLLWKRYLNLREIEGTGNCLAIYFVDSNYVLVLENCANQYPILCAYDALNVEEVDCVNETYVLHSYPDANKYTYLQDELSCPFGDISKPDSSRRTKIYQMLLREKQCAVNVFPNTQQVNYRKPVITANYTSVAPCGKNCALNITNWMDHFSKIEFINWKVADIGFGDKIVVDSTGAWMLYYNPKCTVCEDTIGFSTIPTIILQLNSNNNLTLTISVDGWEKPNDNFPKLCNFKKLLGINCLAQYDNLEFDNLDPAELVERYFHTYSSQNILTANDLNGITYNEVYSMPVIKSGHFWCEGYSIYHNLVIPSDNLYVGVVDGTENFAVIMKVVGFPQITQYVIENIFNEELKGLIESALVGQWFSVKAVQFKIMISLNYDDRQLIALVHFETELKDFEEGSSIDEMPYYKLLKLQKDVLWQTMITLRETRYTFYSINHTRFCLPENNIVNGTEFIWDGAELNEYVTAENFTLDENGLPIIRHCIGDNLYGAQWDLVNELNGGSFLTGGPVTNELLNLGRLIAVQSNESLEMLYNISSIVAGNINNLIPADLFTISKVLSNLNSFNFRLYNSSDNLGGITDMTGLINSCTRVNESVIQAVQVTNTTNTILYSFEMAISNIGGALTRKIQEWHSPLEESSNVLVIVLNPYANNISGILVYKNLTKPVFHDDISDYYIEYIMSNSSIPTFKEGFTIASYVPQKLLNDLMVINHKLQIIMTLFYNDVLYQDEKNAGQLDSVVISVTIPGISSHLPGFIPFYFTSKTNRIYTQTSNSSMNYNKYCSYWNFQPKNNTIKSEWSQNGCHFLGLFNNTMNTSQISACACDHLTSFAFLVGDMDVSRINDTVIKNPTVHDQALDLITLLGCSLSILGVLGLFVTALVFPVWRRKSIILLQFSAAIALQMVLTLCVTTNLFDFKITPNMKWTVCIAVGGAVQYSLLVVFAWTLISAYLQFKRYVAVFNSKPSKLYLKVFIFGWIVPVVPVLLGAFISPESYRKSIKNSFNVCYPVSYALYFSVLLPIGVIILANLTIFILVVRNVFRMSKNKFHTKEKALIFSQLRLSIFLFFLLGLSWFFGLANSFGLGLVFTYLFCLTATVQGLVLFIYFVIMDPETRMLWAKFLCCKSYDADKLT